MCSISGSRWRIDWSRAATPTVVAVVCRCPKSTESTRNTLKVFSAVIARIYTSEEDRRRFGERVKQQNLARVRGEDHLGLSAAALKRKRQQARQLRQARSDASKQSDA